MPPIQSLYNASIFNIEDLSATTAAISDSFSASQLDSFSLQAAWTGFSGTANILVTASNDNSLFSLIDTIAISGSASDVIDIQDPKGYSHFRFELTTASASGTLVANMHAKGWGV